MGAGGVINDAETLCVGRLNTEEGFTSTVKKDIYGNDFIGFGFTPSKGISRYAALALMRAQVEELQAQLQMLRWYMGLDSVRQSVCLDIAFNEGLHGLLNFHRMITFLADKDWASAAKECAVQDEKLDKSRYAPLRELILKGVG